MAQDRSVRSPGGSAQLPVTVNVRPPIRKAKARQRVGFIASALGGGGVERWLASLIKHTKHHVDWVGVGIESSIGPIAKKMIGVEYSSGPDACVQLASRCDSLMLFAPQFAHRYRHESKAKLVFSWHGGPGVWASRQMASPMMRQYDVLHAVGAHSASSFPDPLRSSVRIVPNCVDPEWIEPSVGKDAFMAAHGLNSTSDIVAVVGRISAEKRWHISARGSASVPGAHVAIAGGVSHSDHLDSAFPWFVREAMPGCTPVGWLDNVGDLLQCSSAFVSCSDISEGCGFNMMEAALAGVPIISTRTGICMDEPDLMSEELPIDVSEQHVSEAVRRVLGNKASSRDSARRAQLIMTSRYNMTEWRRNWERFFDEI